MLALKAVTVFASLFCTAGIATGYLNVGFYSVSDKFRRHGEHEMVSRHSPSTAVDKTTGKELFVTDQTEVSNYNRTGEILKNFYLESAKYGTFQVGIGIHVYWTPVLVVVGVLGNSLSLAVNLQRQNRHISCCLYMAALAISDNIMLTMAAYGWAAYAFFTRPYDKWECKFLAWLFQVFSLNGICLVVAMTADRFTAVYFPLKAARICKPIRAKITSIAILFALLAYNIPYIFVSHASGRSCTAFTFSTKFGRVFSWVSLILNSVLPFSMILIFNILIIRTIRIRRKYFDQMEKGSKTSNTTNRHGSSKQSSVPNKDMQLTLMLLMVSFALLLLTMPQYLRYLAFLLVDYTSDPKMFALYTLMFNISHKLYLTNNAINFFLYCIGGSKFRQEVRDVICCKRKLSVCHSRSKIQDTSNNMVSDGQSEMTETSFQVTYQVTELH